MAEDTAPRKTPRKPSAREDRLKAALKANMARRKAQARKRAAQDDGAGASGPQQTGTGPEDRKQED
ncbi:MULTISPECIES: hypothetical protein [unclassified Sulfitobacter]|jgi:hypothetical protein|uniref:hypothetical protein n=1 Tax=unclassified Sulfitobacter TaxID=196795 RepID=UPI0007C2F0A5|nr:MULTISPECIES: hypothetical protein [unclassified Sulfitobacter]KZX95262.1 hypothetical protein A3721_22540 [Sulfitobacter sp. HI0023]KZY03711.1 hypothetical protein A3721_03275 [Sulfitobacter sp. HI0023]KZY27238.1 hypothetical protein A3728_13170 [Sulfitobacter sp. HI0040]KZZ64452.1 hypothetical protein A3764_04555 [Sulfitobacter sp. HI0129]